MTLTRELTVDLTADLTSSLNGFSSIYGPNLMADQWHDSTATVDWSWDDPTGVLTRTGSGGSAYFGGGFQGEVSPLLGGHLYQFSFDVTGWSGDSFKLTICAGDHTGQLSGNGHFAELVRGGGDNGGLAKVIAWAGTAAGAVFSNFELRLVDEGLYGENLFTADAALSPTATIDWSYDVPTNVLTRTGSSGGCTFSCSTAIYANTHLVNGDTYLIEYDVTGHSGDSWSVKCGDNANIGAQSGNGSYSHLMVAGTLNQNLVFIAWGGGAAAAVFSNLSIRQVLGGPV